MKWTDLRIVLALARAGRLSGAAAALGVTHTTISRRLAALEERTGVRLFDRTPEGYVATPAGEDAAEVAERLEAEVLGLEARIGGRDARLHGALRISTMDLLFTQHHQLFSSFIARYPGIDVTLSATDDPVSLTRREADVALRLTNRPPEYLVGRRVGTVDFAVYAHADLVTATGPDASWSDYPWIHWDARADPAAARWMQAWLTEHAPGARIALRVGLDSRLLHDAVAAGLGVHFLSCPVGDADPRLVRLGPTLESHRRSVWVLTLPELQHTPRVRAFMDHAHAHDLSADAALMSHRAMT